MGQGGERGIEDGRGEGPILFEPADSNVKRVLDIAGVCSVAPLCFGVLQKYKVIDYASRTLYQNVSPARANPGGTTNTLHPFSDTPGLCVVDCVCCRWCAAIHKRVWDEVYGSVGGV